MATTITVVCPYCQNHMRASSDYIGRRGRCPSCKELVKIGVAADSEAAGADVSTTDYTPAESSEPPAQTTTDIPAWLSGLIGVAATIVLYLLVFLPLRNTGFGQLFVARGFIPYVVVLITCWGMATLSLKWFAVKRQQSYADLELELIPLDIGLTITPANVDQFLNNLAQLSPAHRGSILGRRIQGALEYFKARNSVPEVQQYLASQAEIDASGVDAGYTLLRAFIWAVPILGFIGTVMGISQAVTGLSVTLDAGGEIMSGLGLVTTGLSTAFDTTLIALVMAILLLFPTEALRKTEYRMLDRIEAFTNESLLRRLADEDMVAQLENMPDVVKFALQTAFQEHQRWLAQWQAQVSELGQIVGADFEEHVNRVQTATAQRDQQHAERIAQASEAMKDGIEKLVASTQSWYENEESLAKRFNEIFGAARALDTNFVEAATLVKEAMSQQRQSLDGNNADDLGAILIELRREVGRLADRLDQRGNGASRDGTSTADGSPQNQETNPEAASKPDKESSGFFGIFRRS